MKSTNVKLLIALCLTVSLMSCQKETEEEKITCTLTDGNIAIEPVCSFDPSVLQTVAFPVRVLVDGVVAVNPTYSFSWSSDESFQGSAISVTYTQLPLEIILTDTETDCTAQATLSAVYW